MWLFCNFLILQIGIFETRSPLLVLLVLLYKDLFPAKLVSSPPPFLTQQHIRLGLEMLQLYSFKTKVKNLLGDVPGNNGTYLYV